MKENFNKSYVGLRKDIINLINGSNLEILDVGCSTGVNGKFLLDNNIAKRVVGIEYDGRMAAVASEVYSDVLVGDLNEIALLDYFNHDKFDYIIAGDILEHLYKPDEVLLRLGYLLKKNGRIIISLPNIRHIDVFIHLFIKKTWPRNKRGIFDETHIKFFTINDMIDLIDFADLRVIDYHRNFRYRDNGSRFPFYGKLLLNFFPDLFTFQYLLRCELKK